MSGGTRSQKLSYKKKYPLHDASACGSVEKVKSLLESGAYDINVTDSNLNTPLHIACHRGYESVVRYLLEFEKTNEQGERKRPILLGIQDMYHRTPLHLAVSAKHEAIVQLLIKKCPTYRRKQFLDMKEVRQRTSVFIAARKGYLYILDILLSHGADPNLQDEKLRSPLYYLCTPISKADRRLSYEVGYNVHETSLSPSENEIVKCIALLIKYGADPNDASLRKDTPLHVCAMYNKMEYLNILLRSPLGCDFTAKNEDNLLPHQIAQTLNHAELYNFIFGKYTAQRRDEFKKKGLLNLTKEDVVEYIDIIGMGQYATVFRENHIDGKTLASLDITSLKQELAILPLGHRKDIMRSIDELRLPSFEQLRLSNGQGARLNKINPTDVSIGDIIGSGYFGEVRRGVWSGTEVAIKRFYRDEDKKKALEREMPIIAKLRHPNILSFFGVMVNDQKDIMLITELMGAGNLFANIKNNYPMIKRVRHKIALDIAKGMRHMHACNFLHRDLNTKNILLNDNYIAKISDFGLSRIMNDKEEMTSNVGFIAYMAPEIREGKIYTEKADVYSYGMVLYELFTGMEPHHEFEKKKETLMFFSRAVSIDGYRPPLSSFDADVSWKKLIIDCWDHDPTLRPSFLEIFERIESIISKAPVRKMMVEDTENTYFTED